MDGRIGAAFAVVLAIVPLVGWALGVQALAHWGIEDHLAWPLTALALFLLAIALLLEQFERAGLSRILLMLPVAIAATSLFQPLSGTSLGVDTLLFRDSVLAFPFPTAGRPRIATGIVMLLLAVAIWHSPQRRRSPDLLIVCTTGLVVGISTLSVALDILDDGLHPREAEATMSTPAATIAFILAVVIATLPRRRPSQDSEWQLVPDTDIWIVAFLTLPALLLYTQVRLVQSGALTLLTSAICATSASVLLVIALILWWSERVRDQHNAVRASELRLQTAADAHSLGIFEWDIPRDTISWSPGAEQRMGLEPGSIHDFQSWKALVLPEDVEAIEQSMAAAAARQSERFTFHYRFRKTNGAVRAVEGSSRCIYDENGRLIRTVGVNVDVTDRLEREADLAAREAQLRSILETVPDAMIIIDEQGVIRNFSAAAERMFGYAADEVIGRNISCLTPAELQPLHDGFLARYRDTGERRVIGRIRYLSARCSDGSEIPIELNVGEAMIGGQRLFTGFIRDISERVAAEARLSDLRNEYARVARLTAMGELAAGLAHELNQPLAATANYLSATHELIRRGGDADQAAEMADMARKQVLRAGEIIRRLRDFIARREIEVAIEPIEQTVREAAALVLAGGNQHEVRITYAFGAGADAMLADRVQIQQVLVNLIKNAVDALGECPRGRRQISISAIRQPGSMVQISVADSGPGLGDKLLRGVYEPFSSTKGDQGLGMGLLICRRIIDAHGGELTATNSPSGGAVFSFTLPHRVGLKEAV